MGGTPTPSKKNFFAFLHHSESILKKSVKGVRPPLPPSVNFHTFFFLNEDDLAMVQQPSTITILYIWSLVSWYSGLFDDKNIVSDLWSCARTVTSWSTWLLHRRVSMLVTRLRREPMLWMLTLCLTSPSSQLPRLLLDPLLVRLEVVSLPSDLSSSLSLREFHLPDLPDPSLNRDPPVHSPTCSETSDFHSSSQTSLTYHWQYLIIRKYQAVNIGNIIGIKGFIFICSIYYLKFNQELQ